MLTSRDGLQRCFPRFPWQSSRHWEYSEQPISSCCSVLENSSSTPHHDNIVSLEALESWCTCLHTKCDYDSLCPTVHSPKALIMHYSPSELEPTLIIAYLLVGHLISQLLWKHPCSKSTGREQISSHVKKNPPHSSHWGRQCACLISASKDISHIWATYLIVQPEEANTK